MPVLTDLKQDENPSYDPTNLPIWLRLTVSRVCKVLDYLEPQSVVPYGSGYELVLRHKPLQSAGALVQWAFREHHAGRLYLFKGDFYAFKVDAFIPAMIEWFD